MYDYLAYIIALSLKAFLKNAYKRYDLVYSGEA